MRACMIARGSSLVIAATLQVAAAQSPALDAKLDQELPALVSTYKALHAAPELSHHEDKTAALLALPVEEQTGLPYASHVYTKNDAGVDVGVMHACGHDIHVTTLIGTAKLLAAMKDQWHGTLVLIGQPSEETIDGARAMLAD